MNNIELSFKSSYYFPNLDRPDPIEDNSLGTYFWSRSNTILTYDENGNVIEAKSNENDLIGKSLKYFYDEEGKLINAAICEDAFKNGRNVSYTEMSFAYDEQDRLASELHRIDINGDNLIDKTEYYEYIYDEEGKLIQLNTTSQNENSNVDIKNGGTEKFYYDEFDVLSKITYEGDYRLDGTIDVYEEVALKPGGKVICGDSWEKITADNIFGLLLGTCDTYSKKWSYDEEDNIYRVNEYINGKLEDRYTTANQFGEEEIY